MVECYGQMLSHSTTKERKNVIHSRFGITHGSKSDLVEVSLGDGPEVWSSFVTQFRDMHNNALSIRKQTLHLGKHR